MNNFKCKLCKRKAKWLVWYEGCGSLYTYLCDKHAYKHMSNEDTLYPVVCVRSIEQAIGKVSEVRFTSHGFTIDVPLGDK